MTFTSNDVETYLGRAYPFSCSLEFSDFCAGVIIDASVPSILDPFLQLNDGGNFVRKDLVAESFGSLEE